MKEAGKEVAKNQTPLIFPFTTPLGQYFYDTNRNEIVYVNAELFQYICDVMNKDDFDNVHCYSSKIMVNCKIKLNT